MTRNTQDKWLEITLNKSPIALKPNQRANLIGLGLSRREQVVVRQDNAATRGMIKKVLHLVSVGRPSDTKDTKAVKASPSIEIIAPKEEAPKAAKPRAPKKKTAKEK